MDASQRSRSDGEAGGRRRGRPPRPTAPATHPGLPIDNPLSSLPPTARFILETARRLLLEKGYAALTIENVALEAHETTTAVKHHFISKAGLVEALLDAVDHDAYVDLTREVEALPPGEARIHAYITGLYYVIADAAASQAIFEIAPQAIRDPLLRTRIAALYDWYRELTLRESGILALLDAHEDPPPETRARLETLATLVLAALDGLAYQYALDPEHFDSAAALAMLDEMVRAAVARL
jgi:AcrR family transcriptional regulator